MITALSTLTKPVEDLNLTVKQAKFLKLFIELGNGSEAAMRVYNCKDRASAGAIAGENLQKLKNPIRLLMEAKGLSLGKLVDVLSGGLSAERETKDGGTIPDWGNRHKYMTSMAKWLGIEEPALIAETINQQFNQQNQFFQIKEEERIAFNSKFKLFLTEFYKKGVS